MKNSDYWQKRFEELEERRTKEAGAYYRDVEKQFRRAENNIEKEIERWYGRLAENNEISYAAAKKLLSKNELAEFHWTVEEYIKKGEENAINQRWMKELENASARVHISQLEAMKTAIQQHSEVLFGQLKSTLTNHLSEIAEDSFYRNAYEIAKGTGVGRVIPYLDTKKIEQILNKTWAADGKRFSDRIWENKQKLIGKLHNELAQSIIRGEAVDKAIKRLSKEMKVSQKQAGRLIMTETAAISSAANLESYKELGIKKYQILATLDNRTSIICQDMDRRVFDLKDYQVGMTAPPFHPFCRTTTIPYFEDEFTIGEQRAAKDEETGKTYYVPADISYKEWKQKYGINYDQNVLEDAIWERIKKNIKSFITKEQVISYDELPKNIKKDFETDLKYANKNVRLLLEHEMRNTHYYITEEKNSQYTYFVNVIGINRKKGTGTIAHELFHRIDDKYDVTKKTNMLNDFMDDFKNNKELFEDPFSYLLKYYPEAVQISAKGKIRLKNEYRGISDIFSALSEGEINLGFIHSKKYWKEISNVQIEEIWAECGAIYYKNNPKVIQMLTELFPFGSERINIKIERLVKKICGKEK